MFLKQFLIRLSTRFKACKTLWASLLGLCWAVLAIIAPLAAQPLATPDLTQSNKVVPQVTASAQKLFISTKPNLFKVRTLVAGTETQASVGSGFLVGKDGYVVTNYHVVSSYVQYPTRYQIVLDDEQNKSHPATLMAIDLLHDLAVLKLTNVPSDAEGLVLAPSDQHLEKGQPLFSFGNPLDEGLSVISGAYNGLAQRFFYETYHFSGAVNQGMSGGPVLNTQKEVVGVNVAHNTQGELMSYLVPVRFVHDILNKVQSSGAQRNNDQTITAQLTGHQKALANRLLQNGFRLESYAGHKVALLDNGLARCWGEQFGEKEDEMVLAKISSCGLSNPVFINQDFLSGGVQVKWTLYQNKGLNALRFASVISKGFGAESLANYESEEYYGQMRCKENFVKNKNAKAPSMRAVICVNPYKKWRGLNTFLVITAIQRGNQSALIGSLDLDGFTFQEGLPIITKWLESIQ